eukprot:763032-Hanusia_phi.AAC.2
MAGGDIGTLTVTMMRRIIYRDHMQTESDLEDIFRGKEIKVHENSSEGETKNVVNTDDNKTKTDNTNERERPQADANEDNQTQAGNFVSPIHWIVDADEEWSWLDDFLDEANRLATGLRCATSLLTAITLTCHTVKRTRSATRGPAARRDLLSEEEKKRRKALLRAIYYRSIDDLKKWRNTYSDRTVDFPVGKELLTPLMLAALRGDMEVVRYLVETLEARKWTKTYDRKRTAADMTEDPEMKEYLSA